MEGESFINRFPQILRENLIAVILGCLGLISLGYGLMPLSDNSSISENIIIDQGNNDSEQAVMIMIDVSGAVKKPGVYELASDARIRDAIAEAGGMSDAADHLYVAKTLNLAQKVTDGMKIYIPSVSDGNSQAVLADTTGLISINNASSSELEELPGVGPVTAKKIIDNRPYATTDELLTKKSVGSSVFEKIKDQISL